MFSFKKKTAIKIKFDKGLQSYTVVKNNLNVLFIGPKEKCQTFLEHYEVA